jgi:hypothetical protein
MASRISRRLWALGRPCPLGAGMWGSMYFHSASERSVGYLFLIPARVANHHPRTTFHTVSLRPSALRRSKKVANSSSEWHHAPNTVSDES